MVMGDKGGSMGEMEMPLPDNTLPMMSGAGPFGGIEMGGMFTTLKVRKDQKLGDYKDPGWYRHPKATQAYEWQGTPPAASRAADANPPIRPGDTVLPIRKPHSHDH
jgi:hypothetical protein